MQRYNLFYSVPVQGDSRPGVSTGTALTAMEAIARRVLPDSAAFEWTDIAYQERAVGNTAIYVFALGVLLVLPLGLLFLPAFALLAVVPVVISLARSTFAGIG